MKLLLDEMHSPVAARNLRQRGHGVHAVADNPLLRGMADADLLGHGADEGFAIVTENVSDFAVLNAGWAADASDHAGLIFTDARRFDRRLASFQKLRPVRTRQFVRGGGRACRARSSLQRTASIGVSGR